MRGRSRFGTDDGIDGWCLDMGDLYGSDFLLRSCFGVRFLVMAFRLRLLARPAFFGRLALQRYP